MEKLPVPSFKGNVRYFNSHQLLHYDFYNLVHLVKICFQESSPHYHRSLDDYPCSHKVMEKECLTARVSSESTAAWSLFTDLTQGNFRCYSFRNVYLY